jgi:hypothetical protein
MTHRLPAAANLFVMTLLLIFQRFENRNDRTN